MKTRLLLVAAPLVLVAAVAAATLPGSASSAAAEAVDGGITVVGTAAVTSVPDRAELSFGVESQGQTAKAALAANAVEMRKVIAAVKAAGGTDVKTQSVSLSPRYNETNEVQAFVATNSVSATIKNDRQGGRPDRRGRDGRRQPGLRAVALERRPDRAVPAGPQDGGRERPRQRAGARRRGEPLARPRDRDRREQQRAAAARRSSQQGQRPSTRRRSSRGRSRRPRRSPSPSPCRRSPLTAAEAADRRVGHPRRSSDSAQPSPGYAYSSTNYLVARPRPAACGARQASTRCCSGGS